MSQKTEVWSSHSLWGLLIAVLAGGGGGGNGGGIFTGAIDIGIILP